MNTKDFYEDDEVWTAAAAIDKILGTGVLNRIRDPLFESAFTTLLINLNDLLQKASNQGQRIDFVDDVGVVASKKGPRDVTTLINDARNAACHVTTAVEKLDFGSMRLCVYEGFMPNAVSVGDQSFGCDYADDIAVQYGPIRVYMRRHVQRCLMELRKVFPMN